MFKDWRQKLAAAIAPAESHRQAATRVADLTPTVGGLFKGAEARGYNDGVLGKDYSANPYDKRLNYAMTPFLRGKVNFWRIGWKRGHEEFLKRRNRERAVEEM